ncbi:TetR/AcrR family transcriptional regulator [Arthrobacter sp. CAU 1506]|uniref:TetR/AcrR family transcriptional regulator n=1 Tax=Arthrobacter sp. CAU 1506 TaxID=2560052 RepID=UPI0010AC9224|nr:TetR/AcrR family transcriptional regulator [Arthrobacter sp. CAU 1506]TJY63680.1 TetR/AcrR family transcriptional regulator [Arthrobacter sp. CAU 1506]
MSEKPSSVTPRQGRKSPRPEQARSVERRGQLLTGAIRLLLSGGVTAVTHRGVAEESNSSPGAVRYYFRTSEDLLAACLEEIERIRAAEAERIIDFLGRGEAVDADRAARLLFRTYYGPAVDDATVTGTTWSIVDCGRESSRLAQMLGQHRQTANRQMEEVLRFCGYPALKSSLAAAVMEGGVLTATVEGGTPVAECAAAGLAEILQLLASRQTEDSDERRLH